MSYYPTIEEDLVRATEILEKGRLGNDWVFADNGQPIGGGIIYGGDVYAAYKLLESLVAEVERLSAVLKHDTLPATCARVQREMIRASLVEHKGNVEATAKALGISRKGLYLKRRRWGL